MGWTAVAAVGSAVVDAAAGAGLIASTTGLAAGVISGAIDGAIVGAVVGGVKSAVTGGNILQGIESGGLIGGVTGGIGGGISSALDGTAVGATGSSTLSAEGLDSQTNNILSNTINSPTNLSDVSTPGGMSGVDTATLGGTDFSQATADAANASSNGDLPNLYQGIGNDQTTALTATPGGAVPVSNSGGASSAGGAGGSSSGGGGLLNSITQGSNNGFGPSMGSAAVQGAFGLVTQGAKGIAGADALATANKLSEEHKVVTPTGTAPATATISGNNFVDSAALNSMAANPELMGSVYKNLNPNATTPTGAPV